jgi:predicted Zn-dependent protease
MIRSRRSWWSATTISLLLLAPTARSTVAQAPRRQLKEDRKPPPIEQQLERFAEQLFAPPKAEEAKLLEAVEISPAEERAYGRQMVAAYEDDLRTQGLEFTHKGRDHEYVRRLVESIRPLMRHADRYPEIVVTVVDSPRVDARSFPGGYLYFFKGLLRFAESEAALVGIIGHELSHLDHGHQLVSLKKSRLLGQEIDQFRRGEVFDPANAAQWIGRFTPRPFRPEDEAMADADGARWAFEAGYDPRAMADLFDRMHKANPALRIPFSSFFRSHPYDEDRRDAILGELERLEQRERQRDGDDNPKLYWGKKNLAQRVTKSQKKFPE